MYIKPTEEIFGFIKYFNSLYSRYDIFKEDINILKEKFDTFINYLENDTEGTPLHKNYFLKKNIHSMLHDNDPTPVDDLPF